MRTTSVDSRKGLVAGIKPRHQAAKKAYWLARSRFQDGDEWNRY